MGIKWKSTKPHPVRAWLSFFLGWTSILVFLVIGAYLQFPASEAGQTLRTLLEGDYLNSEGFIQRMSRDFQAILQYVSGYDWTAAAGDTVSPGDTALESPEIYIAQEDYGGFLFSVAAIDPDLISYIDAECENVIYYAENTKTRETWTNATDEQIAALTGSLRPKGFDYRLHWDGETLNIDKADLPASSSAHFYQLCFPSPARLQAACPDTSDLQIWIAAAGEPVFSSHFYSDQQAYYQSVYFSFLQFQITFFLFQMLLSVLTLSIFLFPYYLFHRADKREASLKIAGFLSHIWIEVKLLLLIVWLILAVLALIDPFWGFSLPADFWVVWLCVLDLRRNGRAVFSKSLIGSLLAHSSRIAAAKPFQKKMIRRFQIFCAVEVLCVVPGFALIGSAVALLMIAAAVWYYISLQKTASDMGLLLDRIDEITTGNPEPLAAMPINPEIHQAVMKLDRIQDGISSAVEERVRSERMKIELITNVSHDIKTPLTSIIGYVDLLRQETDLPDYVRDYIAILARKSERLKNMVQDIFDVSKAASGNIDLEWSTLDLTKLIRQTLADMEENIIDSGLIFRVKLPPDPVFIRTDGNRMYRVFQNLIKNALQYSLEGSRVFVQVRLENDLAVTEIKNTSRYEIDFDSDEITERFVRGDASRSTEGSGLGLSIAKTFTNACGGEFSITTDADLFCAKLEVPLSNQSPEQA